MQYEFLAVFTSSLAFEVDYNGSFSVNLPEGISVVVANGDDEGEQIRSGLSQLRQSLDEVERPLQPLFPFGARFVV